MTYPNKSRYIALYRALQSDHPTAKTQYDSLTEEQKAQFAQFQVDAGNAFLEIKDELDRAVGELGDDFSDPDPRKWTALDWWEFYAGVEGHEYEEILTKYAKGENNMDLIWGEIASRL